MSGEIERVYPVRDPNVVVEAQEAYRAKIKQNQDAGWETFSKGEYTPFRGWSVETSGRTFDTIFELDTPSQQRVIERVVEPLHRLAQAHNIAAIYPGRGDCPPHVVLQPGRFTNLNPKQVEAIKEYLASNTSHLNMLAKILKGLTFHHDTLVIAASTIYICASQFDAEQGGAFKARRIVERIFTRALSNLKSTGQSVEGNFAPPSSYYDIFHSSSMRLTEKAPAENLLAFAREAYATVGEALERDPIPITIVGLYRGIATDYHREHAPQLVIS